MSICRWVISAPRPLPDLPKPTEKRCWILSRAHSKPGDPHGTFMTTRKVCITFPLLEIRVAQAERMRYVVQSPKEVKKPLHWGLGVDPIEAFPTGGCDVRAASVGVSSGARTRAHML